MHLVALVAYVYRLQAVMDEYRKHHAKGPTFNSRAQYSIGHLDIKLLLGFIFRRPLSSDPGSLFPQSQERSQKILLGTSLLASSLLESNSMKLEVNFLSSTDCKNVIL